MRNILIADDHPLMRLILGMIIRAVFPEATIDIAGEFAFALEALRDGAGRMGAGRELDEPIGARERDEVAGRVRRLRRGERGALDRRAELDGQKIREFRGSDDLLGQSDALERIFGQAGRVAQRRRDVSGQAHER